MGLHKRTRLQCVEEGREDVEVGTLRALRWYFGEDVDLLRQGREDTAKCLLVPWAQHTDNDYTVARDTARKSLGRQRKRAIDQHDNRLCVLIARILESTVSDLSIREGQAGLRYDDGWDREVTGLASGNVTVEEVDDKVNSLLGSRGCEHREALRQERQWVRKWCEHGREREIGCPTCL